MATMKSKPGVKARAADISLRMLRAARLAPVIRELHSLSEPHLVVVITIGLSTNTNWPGDFPAAASVPAIASPLVWGARFSTCLGRQLLLRHE